MAPLDAPIHRRPIAVLGAAIAVVFLAAVLVVLGDDGDQAVGSDASVTTAADDPDEPTGSGEPSSTAPGDADAAGGEDPAADPGTATDDGAGAPAPASTAPDSSPPATGSAGAADLGAPQDPGPVQPPAPGRYRYRVEGQASSSDGQQTAEDGEGTTTVTDQAREPGLVRQTVVLEGQGIDSTDTVEWHADRVTVTRSVFRFGGSTGDCDWEPDHLQLVLPLATGATWSSQTTCTVTGFGVPVTVTRSTTNEVTGLARRQVAGQVLDVWVIETREDISFATSRIQARLTSYFSPRHGLVVASDGEAEGGDGAMAGDGTFSAELLNLDPEPA